MASSFPLFVSPLAEWIAEGRGGEKRGREKIGSKGWNVCLFQSIAAVQAWRG
jgi:hypothetical protein